jgi:hypothetical protein
MITDSAAVISRQLDVSTAQTSRDGADTVTRVLYIAGRGRSGST